MKKQVWHKGEPPSIGWWPASAFRDANTFRWWDGKCWSEGAREDCGAELAAIKAKNPPASFHVDRIEWTARPRNWPARSKT